MTVWCAVHVNSVVGSYQFKDETIIEVNFYLMLDTHVRLKDQQFLQDPVFQQNGAPLQIKCSAHYVLIEMIPN